MQYTAIETANSRKCWRRPKKVTLYPQPNRRAILTAMLLEIIKIPITDFRSDILAVRRDKVIMKFTNQ